MGRPFGPLQTGVCCSRAYSTCFQTFQLSDQQPLSWYYCSSGRAVLARERRETSAAWRAPAAGAPALIKSVQPCDYELVAPHELREPFR